MSALFNLKAQTPLFVNLEAYPRLLAGPLPVRRAAFIPHNRYLRRTAVHRSLNLGFILSGSGRSGPPGHVRAIHPPCLVVTPPGILYTSCPDPEWMEFYVTYEPRYLERFRRIGRLQPGLNAWPLAPLDRVVRWVLLLLEEMKAVHAAGSADRIDCLAELLILEVFQRQPATTGGRAPPPGMAAVEAVRRTIGEQAADRPLAWRALARAAGLSPQTFRRLWHARYAMPPAHYIMLRRMEAAGRLLTDTGLSIKEIAGRLGFADALYFSKRFARFAGMAPTHYRRQAAPPPSPRP